MSASDRPTSTAGPSRSPSHVPVVTSDDLGLRYWPSCSCGWAPYAQMSYADALALNELHLSQKGSSR